MRSSVAVVTDHRFRAMGTECHVQIVDGPPGTAAVVESSIRADEARWSRFDPRSEVSQVNRTAGSRVAVSPETVRLVSRAVELRRGTGRRFDPLVGLHVIAAGYDRPFPVPTAPDRPVPAPPPMTGPEVGPEWIRIPVGTALDLGGIAKGHAADRAAAAASAAGAAGVCVNVGGDAACAGQAPDPSGWWFALDHVAHAALGLRVGGVATSTVARRRWRTADGGTAHHLIDPATGRPAETRFASVTVVAGDATTAEALTKPVLLAPVGRATEILGAHGAVAVASDHTGAVRHLGDTTPFLAAR